MTDRRKSDKLTKPEPKKSSGSVDLREAVDKGLSVRDTLAPERPKPNPRPGPDREDKPGGSDDGAP